MEKKSEELLGVLSAFVDNFPISHLEELLKASSKTADEKEAELERYRTIEADIERLRDAFRRYEEQLRPEIEKSLNCFSVLLQNGPERRDALIRQYAVVLARAAEINCLDEEMLTLAGDICKRITVPKNLPAFKGSFGPPSESEWPRFGLKDIFDDKQADAQRFWNSSFQLVLPDIEAATLALKEKKERLDSIVKAMGECVELLTLMSRIMGIVVAL